MGHSMPNQPSHTTLPSQILMKFATVVNTKPKRKKKKLFFGYLGQNHGSVNFDKNASIRDG